MTANELTKAIVNRINLDRESFAYRSGNVPVRGRRNNVKHGVADITAVYRGMAIFIEVKVGRDTMSDAQEQFESEVSAAKGMYFVARTLDGFLTDWGQMTTLVNRFWR